MTPIEGGLAAAADSRSRFVMLGKDQPECIPLPALWFRDGRICTEWTFTEDERQRIARGENVRLWIWTFGHPVQPVALEVTAE